MKSLGVSVNPAYWDFDRTSLNIYFETSHTSGKLLSTANLRDGLDFFYQTGVKKRFFYVSLQFFKA